MTTICEHTITAWKQKKKEKGCILFTELFLQATTICEDHNLKKRLFFLILNYFFSDNNFF
jgi:hypothetical protein